MRTIALIVGLLALLTAAANAQEPVCESCLLIPTTRCAPIVLGSIKIKENTAGYDIDVEYPVLCSPEATRTIRDFSTRELSDFKMDFPEHDLSEYPRRHEMITGYSAWPAAQGRYASIVIQIMVYTGGAHPNNWPVTWVFDLTDGQPLTLTDIFEDTASVLTTIAPMVRKVVQTELGEMYIEDMAESGTIPTKENYEDFIINDEGIVFFFAPYQVAPYAAGQQVVTIPWSQVDSFLKPIFRESLRP